MDELSLSSPHCSQYKEHIFKLNFIFIKTLITIDFSAFNFNSMTSNDDLRSVQLQHFRICFFNLLIYFPTMKKDGETIRWFLSRNQEDEEKCHGDEFFSGGKPRTRNQGHSRGRLPTPGDQTDYNTTTLRRNLSSLPAFRTNFYAPS